MVQWIEGREEARVVHDLGGQVLEIHLPIIRSQLDYATALHEIGHICGRYQGLRYKNLTRERWAWEWARCNALVWTRAMERDAQSTLRWQSGGNFPEKPSFS